MQYHSKILKIVKVTKKNVNRLVFFGHPLPEYTPANLLCSVSIDLSTQSRCLSIHYSLDNIVGQIDPPPTPSKTCIESSFHMDQVERK